MLADIVFTTKYTNILFLCFPFYGAVSDPSVTLLCVLLSILFTNKGLVAIHANSVSILLQITFLDYVHQGSLPRYYLLSDEGLKELCSVSLIRL